MCQKECSKSSLHPLFLEFVQGSSKDSLSSQTEAAAIALLDHLETTGTDTMKRSEIAGAQKEMRTLAEAMKSDGVSSTSDVIFFNTLFYPPFEPWNGPLTDCGSYISN